MAPVPAPLAVSALATVDVASCDARGLSLVQRHLREVESWTSSLRAAVVRRNRELQVNPQRGLEADLGLTLRQARDAIARTEVLDNAPVFEQALVAGAVTDAHIDALGRATKAVPELFGVLDQLLATAERVTPAEFATYCQRVGALLTTEADDEATFERQRRAAKVRRWRDERTGMYCLYAEFDPETGSKLWTAIDCELEAMFHGPPVDTLPDDPAAKNDHLASVALARLVTTNDGGGGRPGTGTRRAELQVLMDLETLLHGKHAESITELATGGTLPVSRLRQLACEADIIPIVLSGNGVVLDVGRARRLATADQRRALQAMYATCGLMPGCTVPFAHTQIHHLKEWTAQQGETDLGELLPGCTQHHGDAHAGRIIVDMDPVTRAVTVRDRHGNVIASSTGPPGRRPRPPT